jgi:hypothetical protein
MNILDDLRYGAAFPLRRRSLEAARALANAQPPPARVQTGRAEQLPDIQPALIGDTP